MAGLTAAEQQEMAALQQELAPKSNSNLSPQEQQEMKALQQEVGQSDSGIMSKIGKGMDFVGNFPTSAIDLIPGAKDRRLAGKERFLKQYESEHGHPYVEPHDDLGALGFVGEAPMIGMGKVASKLSKFLAPAAQRAEVLGKVKNVGELEPYIQGKVNEAAQNFNRYQIEPRMVEQKAMTGGHEVTLQPDQLKGLSPEVDQFIAKYAPKDSPSGSTISVPADEALELREHLNKVNGWKQHPMDAGRAQSADTQAAQAHQNLAQQFSSINPEMSTLSEEMQQAYKTQKQAIGNAGRNPIGAVVQNDGVSGLAKKGRLQRFDEGAGSNLKQLGEDVQTANDRLRPLGGLSDIFTIHGPKKLATKMLTGPAGRSYDYAASAAAPALQQAGQAAQNTPLMSPSYLMQLEHMLKKKSEEK